MIKSGGNWTNSLVELSTFEEKKLKVFISGPYGFPSIDISGDCY